MAFWEYQNYFKFIDFKKELKLCLNPVGKVYAVCALLQNDHICLYGNQVSTFFGMDHISLLKYFSWMIIITLAVVFCLIEMLQK